jgi:hypothetical protein
VDNNVRDDQIEYELLINNREVQLPSRDDPGTFKRQITFPAKSNTPPSFMSELVASAKIGAIQGRNVLLSPAFLLGML